MIDIVDEWEERVEKKSEKINWSTQFKRRELSGRKEDRHNRCDWYRENWKEKWENWLM